MEKRTHELPRVGGSTSGGPPAPRGAAEELVRLAVAKMRATTGRAFGDCCVDVLVERPDLLAAIAGKTVRLEGDVRAEVDGDEAAGRVTVRRMQAEGRLPGPPIPDAKPEVRKP